MFFYNNGLIDESRTALEISTFLCLESNNLKLETYFRQKSLGLFSSIIKVQYNQNKSKVLENQGHNTLGLHDKWFQK